LHGWYLCVEGLGEPYHISRLASRPRIDEDSAWTGIWVAFL
jgi:hypothetical protein